MSQQQPTIEALASALWMFLSENPDSESAAEFADIGSLTDLAANFLQAVPLVQAMYRIDPTKPITNDTAELTAEQMTDPDWPGPLVDQAQSDLIVAYIEDGRSLFADSPDTYSHDEP